MTMPDWNKRPKNPSIWDDEFETDLMHPKWRPIHALTVAPVSEYPLDPHTSSATDNRENVHRHKTSWLCRQNRGSNNDNLQGYSIDISGLPSECILFWRGGRGMRRGTATDGDCEIMMRIANDAINEYCIVMWDSFDTPQAEILFARLSALQGLTYLNIGLVRNFSGFAEPVEYLAVQKQGRTWSGYCASSGGNWVYLNSFTHVVDMTQIAVTFNNNSTATPGTGLAGLDFFRVIPGTKLP